jgi:hypothetical protein
LKPRQKAARRKQSLNRVRAAVGGQRKAYFSDLAGGWTLDTAFDEILAAQRQIDLDKWGML